MQTLILTRPEEQSRRFAALAVARLGPVPVLIAPLMAIRPVPFPAPEGPVSGLIATSSNAVAAWLAAGGRRDLPLCCVGEQAAAMARAAGLPVQLQAPDAAALVQALAARPLPGRWLWLRGRHAARDLLAPPPGGMTIQPLMVYDQVDLPLDPAADALLRGGGAAVIPVFSLRSARLLAGAIGQLPAAPVLVAPVLVALSAGVAQALRDAWRPGPPPRVLTAATPDGGGMLTALAAHFAAPGMG